MYRTSAQNFDGENIKMSYIEFLEFRNRDGTLEVSWYAPKELWRKVLEHIKRLSHEYNYDNKSWIVRHENVCLYESLKSEFESGGIDIRVRDLNPNKFGKTSHNIKTKKQKGIAHPVPKPIKVFVDYKSYIKSSEWKSKADLARKRAGYRCQVCYTDNETLDVHHRTYERLGRELDEDLIVLCRSCHSIFEEKSKNRPSKKK